MIRLSRMTDYAIAILSQMGEGHECLWTAPDLAGRTGLPQPTTSKILKKLTKSGILGASRGAGGGYRLIRDKASISVATVIEAMDGPIAITDCTTGSISPCGIDRICPMSGGWNRINQAIKQALETVSIAELSAGISSSRLGDLAPERISL